MHDDVILSFISFDSVLAQFRTRSIHRVLIFFFVLISLFFFFFYYNQEKTISFSYCPSKKESKGTTTKRYIYIHIYLQPEQMLSCSIVQLSRCCSSISLKIKRDLIKRNRDTPRSWQVYERLCEIPDWTQCKSRDLRSCSCTLAKRSLWMRWRLVDSRQSASCKSRPWCCTWRTAANRSEIHL